MESLYAPYTAVLIGMMIFLALVGASVIWVASLRQAEIRRYDEGWLAQRQPLQDHEIRLYLVYLASPLDSLVPYHLPEPEDTLNQFTRLLEQVPGPLIRPMRVQDTLLFADTLNAETTFMPRAS
jgi:hypothetical protein